MGNSVKIDYAYKDISEVEEILGYTVNESFKTGFSMARMTNPMFGKLDKAHKQRKKSKSHK